MIVKRMRRIDSKFPDADMVFGLLRPNEVRRWPQDCVEIVAPRDLQEPIMNWAEDEVTRRLNKAQKRSAILHTGHDAYYIAFENIEER